MELIVNALLPSDWDAVRAIYAEGIATALATFETTVPSWNEWDARHLRTCRLVARADGAVVGFAALSPVSARACYKGVCEVSVYVAASEQRRGTGRTLLEALIAAAEAAGIWTLQGSTFARNEASLRLQARCGFRVVGTRERIAARDGLWHDTILTERRSATIGRSSGDSITAQV